MIILKIKKLLIYVFAHISLSMIWLFFLEIAFKIKHFFTSFGNLKFNTNTVVGVLFASMFFYTLKVHSESIQNFTHFQGVLFGEDARRLTPDELSIVFGLVSLSAILMAFFRGPLVFVGYFLAFISYVVYISF